MKIGCLKYTTTKVSVCDMWSFVPDGYFVVSSQTRLAHFCVSFLLAHNVTMEPGDLGRFHCLRVHRCSSRSLTSSCM
jgi:hypothetical protein